MSYRQTIGAFAIAKFALGAWLIVIVIPILVGLMLFVGRQYARRRAETAVRPELVVGPPRRRQRVLIPASDVTRDVVKAVKFGRTMSDDVSAIHVTDDLDRAAAVRERFARQLPGLPLIVLESPFRSLVRPLIRYLDDIAGAAADDVIVVLLPEYLPRHWWERFLYNDNAHRIEQSLLGRANILVAAVPFRRDVQG